VGEIAVSLLPNTEQNAALEAERVAFEAAVCKRYGYTGVVSRRVGDYYADASLSQAWAFWQARAQLAAPAGVVLPERKKGWPSLSNHRSYNSGWNACIDETACLNAAPSPAPASFDHSEDVRHMVSDVVQVPRELANRLLSRSDTTDYQLACAELRDLLNGGH
jgi:hypothetical protein